MRKMKRFSLQLLGFAVIAIAAPVALPVSVHAQEDGETRCGADGNVQQWSSSQNSWTTHYGVHCAGNSSRSDEHYGQRGDSQPADGDEKCGPDGFVLQYHRYSQSWSTTGNHCK